MIMDLSGQRYGRLTVIKRASNDQHGTRRWECQCDCGTIKIVAGMYLRNGRTLSCGCLRRELPTTHGDWGSVESSAWHNMKQRCTNPNERQWMDYGGRGIRVCEEWMNDYPAFLAYIGRRPSPEHSLDRIDNNGNYEPGNVRWATKKEQANNRR